MGIFREEILASAAVFCGEERERLLPLCDAAEAELRGRLRKGITPETDLPTFLTAAAFYAAAAFWELASMDAGSVKVGQVTLQKHSDGNRKRAEDFRRRADLLLAPFLCDGDFTFMRVKGS